MDLLQSLKDIDEKLFEFVKKSEDLAFSEGKIPLKYKYLMAMAIDTCQGASDGVKALAKAAIENGASREEIAEALTFLTFSLKTLIQSVLK